ncbi:MAG: DinB family protein [Pyrinomonadaceae bacterium]|nr:DinB family protein [Pyrinomonadaceae bacterium]
MTEVERIKDQLRRSFEGEAWHGPAVKELLAGISAKQAAAKPLPDAHSIWELVHHIAAWQETVRQRLDGEPVDSPLDGDWPDLQDTREAAWAEMLSKLDRSYEELFEKVSLLSDERLNEVAAARAYPVYFMLHGIIQHNLYHAGQIALLKKSIEATE